MMEDRCPKCNAKLSTIGICLDCQWGLRTTTQTTPPVKMDFNQIEHQTANRLIEWSKALDRLIEAAEVIGDFATGSVVPPWCIVLVSAQKVQELADAVEDVKRLRGE